MKILETIKALLAKAASTDNENEAATFAAKANELMEKYQVDIDAIRASDDPVGRDSIYSTVRASPSWRADVASATARYYGCRVVRTAPYVDFRQTTDYQMFGRESARMTALEMLPYFIATVNRLANQMSKETDYTVKQCAKQIGLSFARRLGSLAPKFEKHPDNVTTGKNALIRLDEINAMVEEAFPSLRKARAKSFKASAHANALAASINIGGQVRNRGSALAIGAK